MLAVSNYKEYNLYLSYVFLYKQCIRYFIIIQHYVPKDIAYYIISKYLSISYVPDRLLINPYTWIGYSISYNIKGPYLIEIIPTSRDNSHRECQVSSFMVSIIADTQRFFVRGITITGREYNFITNTYSSSKLRYKLARSYCLGTKHGYAIFLGTNNNLYKKYVGSKHSKKTTIIHVPSKVGIVIDVVCRRNLILVLTISGNLYKYGKSRKFKHLRDGIRKCACSDTYIYTLNMDGSVSKLSSFDRHAAEIELWSSNVCKICLSHCFLFMLINNGKVYYINVRSPYSETCQVISTLDDIVDIQSFQCNLAYVDRYGICGYIKKSNINGISIAHKLYDSLIDF